MIENAVLPVQAIVHNVANSVASLEGHQRELGQVVSSLGRRLPYYGCGQCWSDKLPFARYLPHLFHPVQECITPLCAQVTRCMCFATFMVVPRYPTHAPS